MPQSYKHKENICHERNLSLKSRPSSQDVSAG